MNNFDIFLLLVAVLVATFSALVNIVYRLFCLIDFWAMCKAFSIKIKKRSIWLILFFYSSYLQTLQQFLVIIYPITGCAEMEINDIDDIQVKLPANGISEVLISFIELVYTCISYTNSRFGEIKLTLKGGGDGIIREIQNHPSEVCGG